VAYGTSAPELVVSVQAAVGGTPDVALGNVVGSNIGNIGLILGVAALVSPIRANAQLLWVDIPIMIGVSALLLALLWDGVVGRLNGAVLVLGAGAYTVVCIWGARDESQAVLEDLFDDGVPAKGSLGRDLLFGIGGLALLVLGARFLVSGAVTVAEALGISTAVIGLTVVALGTSLPELATSVVAALRGQSDLAQRLQHSRYPRHYGLCPAPGCVWTELARRGRDDGICRAHPAPHLVRLHVLAVGGRRSARRVCGVRGRSPNHGRMTS
jgi:cation:H+ antiporter